jgi:hypothetical protein
MLPSKQGNAQQSCHEYHAMPIPKILLSPERQKSAR